MSFVGIRTAIFEESSALGPVKGWAFIPSPKGKPRFKGYYHLMGRAVARILWQRITGRWKDTPFFDIATGNPVRPVEVLPKGTRAKALAEAAN